MLMTTTLESPLKINEFATALNIHPQEARQMARSEIFQRLKISIDIACIGTLPTQKYATGRRNKKWRIYWSKYEAVRDKGLLAP